MRIRNATDCCIMYHASCISNRNMGEYRFEIISFAPDSELIASNRIKKIETLRNLYSVGLIVRVGDYNIMLAGDVENETINSIPDDNIDYPMSYIKIPHHGSSSAVLLVNKLENVIESAPLVAATTVYRKHGLPEKAVLRRYKQWNANMQIYSTEDIINDDCNTKKYGIVKTTFDVLEKREYNIETELQGNAVMISNSL